VQQRKPGERKQQQLYWYSELANKFLDFNLMDMYNYQDKTDDSDDRHKNASFFAECQSIKLHEGLWGFEGKKHIQARCTK
jgi:hypothetical protein